MTTTAIFIYDVVFYNDRKKFSIMKIRVKREREKMWKIPVCIFL